MPVSATTSPEETYDLDLGEAAMLTGVVVSPGSRDEARQANVDAHAVIGKMAATTVRRLCNQHRCTAPAGTPCGHPEHRRDADYLRHVLTLLGLPGDYQEVTQEDREQLLVSLAQQGEDDLSTLDQQGDQE